MSSFSASWSPWLQALSKAVALTAIVRSIIEPGFLVGPSIYRFFSCPLSFVTLIPAFQADEPVCVGSLAGLRFPCLPAVPDHQNTNRRSAKDFSRNPTKSGKGSRRAAGIGRDQSDLEGLL